MKTLTKVLLLFSLVQISLYSSAQGTGGNKSSKKQSVKENSKHSQSSKSLSKSPKSYRKSNIKSNCDSIGFIGCNWPFGILVYQNGSINYNYRYRYDIEADQIHFIADKDTLIFASPDVINTLTFGNHTFIYEFFTGDDSIQIKKGYFELIEPGKNKLLLKRIAHNEFDGLNNPALFNTQKHIDNWYYISKSGQPAFKVLINRKFILSVLDHKKEEIEEFLRITENKLKDIEDLKKMVSYYNSIVEGN